MQCQTANMMQLEVNITFTCWLQVACREKENNWKYLVLFQKPQGYGFGHFFLPLSWRCELVEHGLSLLVRSHALERCCWYPLGYCWISFFERNVLDFIHKMCQELCFCEVESGAKALDDLYSPQDWSALIGFPCTWKLCACNLSLITELLRLEGTSGDHIIQHTGQSRVS